MYIIREHNIAEIITGDALNHPSLSPGIMQDHAEICPPNPCITAYNDAINLGSVGV